MCVKFAAEDAVRYLAELVPLIEDVCESVTICGDLRRGRTSVARGVLVAVPKSSSGGLFDGPSLSLRLESLGRSNESPLSIVEDAGRRLSMVWHYGGKSAGFPIHLTICDATELGWTLIQRTGPAAFLEIFNAGPHEVGGGARLRNHKIDDDGRLIFFSRPFEGTTEQHVFESFDLEYIPPAFRNVGTLTAAVFKRSRRLLASRRPSKAPTR